MANFIIKLIAWGLFFLSAGTLAEITTQLMGLAAESSQSGLVNLTKFNADLTNQKSRK